MRAKRDGLSAAVKHHIKATGDAAMKVSESLPGVRCEFFAPAVGLLSAHVLSGDAVIAVVMTRATDGHLRRFITETTFAPTFRAVPREPVRQARE